MPIFTLEDTRNFRLEVTVDESDIGLVRMGQSAAVTIDAFGDRRTFLAKWCKLFRRPIPPAAAFLVKIELPAERRLRSGLFGRAHFARGARSALLIPPVDRCNAANCRACTCSTPTRLRNCVTSPLGNRVADKSKFSPDCKTERSSLPHR